MCATQIIDDVCCVGGFPIHGGIPDTNGHIFKGHPCCLTILSTGGDRIFTGVVSALDISVVVMLSFFVVSAIIICDISLTQLELDKLCSSYSRCLLILLDGRLLFSCS